MSHNRSLVAASTSLVCGLSLMASAAIAGDKVASQAKAEVAQHLHRIEAAFSSGASGDALAKMLYSDNVLMIGEGQATASRGMKTAMSDSTEWLKSLGPNGGKTCKYTIEEPYVASATTFTSFLRLRCKANPPVLPNNEELRMMYAWEKGPAGWRVVIEMWAPGEF